MRHLIWFVLSLVSTAHADPASDARAFETRYRGKLTSDEKKLVDDTIAGPMHAPRNMRTSAAIGLANRAVALAATGVAPAVFISLAAKAAELAPDAPVAWNDLAALVRQVDVKASVGPAERAVTLQPRSAIALVNLGSSYAELGDKRGVKLLRRAVELAPNLGVAHEALGSVLLVAGDKSGAADQARAALADGDGNPGVTLLVVTLEQAGEMIETTLADLEGPLVIDLVHKQQDTQLVLPPEFRPWKDPLDMVADLQSYGDVGARAFKNGVTVAVELAVNDHGAEMHAGREAIRQRLEKHDHTTVTSQQVEALLKNVPYSTLPHSPISGHQLAQFEVLTGQYQQKLKKSWQAMRADYKAPNAQLADDEKVIRLKLKPYEDQIKAIESRMEHAQDPSLIDELMDVECRYTTLRQKLYNAAIDNWFPHQPAALGEWSEIRTLLAKYWKATGRVVDQMLDTQTFEYAGKLRRTVVNSMVGAVFMLPLGSMAQVGLLYNQPLMCPGTKESKPQKVTATAKFEVPEPPSLCKQLLPQPVSLAIGPFEGKYGCDEGYELELAALGVVSVKRTFKTRETQVFIGVGLEEHAAIAEVGVMGGGTFTFTDGQLVDVGGKLSVSAAVSAGVLQAKVEVSATLSAVAPATIDGELPVGLKLFQPKGEH